MSDRLRPRVIAAVGLAAAGVVLTLYLTRVHYDASALVCTVGDCHAVQQSQFAAIGPLPVSLLGLAMFAVILICELAASWRPEAQFAAALVGFAVALSGALFSVYLTWLEVFVIHAICQWCLLSAGLTLALMVLEGLALWTVMAGVASENETVPPSGTSMQAGTSQRGTRGPGRPQATDGKIVT